MGSKDRQDREKALLRQRREKEILDAAEKLFLEKGFQKTTIKDIAESCELTNGAIYLYFKNKNEIILIIMVKISRTFGDFLSAADSQGGSGADRLKRLLYVYNTTFKEFTNHHILDAQFNMLFDQNYPESPYLNDYFQANQRVLNILISVIEEGLKDRSLHLPGNSNNSVKRMAGMVLNVINSYVEKISLRKRLMELEQGIIVEEELRDFIDYLLGTFIL